LGETKKQREMETWIVRDENWSLDGYLVTTISEKEMTETEGVSQSKTAWRKPETRIKGRRRGGKKKRKENFHGGTASLEDWEQGEVGGLVGGKKGGVVT